MLANKRVRGCGGGAREGGRERERERGQNMRNIRTHTHTHTHTHNAEFEFARTPAPAETFKSLHLRTHTLTRIAWSLALR